MMVDRTRLSEAIVEAVGFYDGVEEAMPDAFRVLVAHARAVVEAPEVWWCKWTNITDEGKLSGTLPGSAAWLECFRSHGRATGHGSCGWAVVVLAEEES
jgi:hypothetical protein